MVNKQKWKFEKTVELTHVFVVVSVAFTMVLWGFNLDKRVSLLEQSAEDRNKSIKVIHERINELHNKMDTTLLYFKSRES